MNEQIIETLAAYFAKMPSLGKRSGMKIALHLLAKKEILLQPLIDVLNDANDKVKICECGNLSENYPCSICSSDLRDNNKIAIVKDITSLWSVEATGIYDGKYFIIGDVNFKNQSNNDFIERLKTIIKKRNVNEVIFAMPLNIDGKTLQYFIMQELGNDITYCELAHGVPIGGELEYLDQNTLASALKNRNKL